MPFQCSKCSQHFFSQDLLKQHISAVHAKKIFRCSSCNQRFNQKNLLNSHNRSVHEEKTHFTALFLVVVSDSMEPSFHRGDVLPLTNYKQEESDIRVGEIIDFDVDIVHRVLMLHEKEDGTVAFLTERVNNTVDDQGLYASGHFWLKKIDIDRRRTRGFFPYVGIVNIIMKKYAKFRYALLACLGFYVLSYSL